MIQWCHECDIFTEQNFQHLLESFGVTSRAELHANHPVFAEVQRRLQLVENAWAKAVDKPPAHIQLSFAPDILSERSGHHLTPAEKWRATTRHNFINNIHYIPWRPTIFEFSELELLNSMRHETEHGSQSVGYGYTDKERKLIWIERSCKPHTEDFYWVRFSEMTARMKEAEWCIECLTTNKDSLSVYDRQSMLNTAQGVLRRLTYDCSLEKLKGLKDAQLKYLSHKILPARYASMAFPDTNILLQKSAICRFLRDEANTIYDDCFAKLEVMRKRLSTCIEECQQALPKELQQYEHKQENERLQKLAQIYNIPVLPDAPGDIVMVSIHGDKCAEQHIRQAVEHQYSPAIVISANKPAQLIFDNIPIPRAYSTSADLQKEWVKMQKNTPDYFVDNTPILSDDELEIE